MRAEDSMSMKSTLIAVMAMLLAGSPAVAAPAPARAASGTITRLALPAPTGPERVGTVSLHLVDRSRADPWVATEPARELMVQVWYPARDVRGYPRADWVSPGVAAVVNPPGSGLDLPVTHGHTGAPAASGRRPVLLYSPGFGLERTASTALVEDLASRGFVVVTIDHTHDAQLVEFPGGRLATQAIPQPSDPAEADRILAKVLDVRVADTRFVLDQVAAIGRGRNPDAEGRALPRGLAQALDLSRVGMLGHSMGGATAGQAMLVDRRIRAGLNLDGTVYGSVLSAGLDRPFMLLGAEPEGAETDETWDQFWARLRGPRYRLQLDGTRHLSFTDFQVLFAQIRLPAEDLRRTVGTIDGQRSVAVQRAYVGAFFDRQLRHRGGRLLAGPSAGYPEMRFLP